MTYPVIAHTRYDGPVVLRTCATQDEQRRFYREAVADWQTGGYDDVERISIDADVLPRTTTDQPTTFVQEALL